MSPCKHCGFKNDEDAVYCSRCGRRTPPARSGESRLGRLVSRRSALIAVVGILGLAGAWHLVGSDLLKRKERRGIEVPRAEEMREKLEEMVGRVADADREVGELPGAPVPLEAGMREVERADDYRYEPGECNPLVTDTAQGIAYNIERAVLEATRMSAEEENALGRDFARHIAETYAGRLDVDRQWVEYLEKLGRRLTSRVRRPGIAYHFHVIREDTVNAFAIPGGGIYFFTGMLETVRNEAQLAAILAHEIQHVDLRHCIAVFQVVSRMPEAARNPVAITIAGLLKHPYNARLEADADRRGLELVYSFGYSPYQVVGFWEELSGGREEANPPSTLFGRIFEEIENVFNTHPDYPKRVCLLKTHILELQRVRPMPLVYVGEWNLEHKTDMFRRTV